MGYLHLMYLEADKIYGCSKCKIHLTELNELNSKNFQGRHGKAYLFNKVINVTQGSMEDRLLITGLHTVCDIHCNNCLSILGWKYERAYEVDQKYKEGKTILERKTIIKLGWV